MRKLRRAIYELIESEKLSRPSKFIRRALAVLIVINIVGVVLGTVPSLSSFGWLFAIINHVSLVVFTTEYVLRLWVVGERVDHPVWGRIRFALTPMMIIDLVAILPGILPGDLDLRSIRAFRLIRLLKLTRHSDALSLVIEVLVRKRDELLSTAFVAFLMLTVASSLMYYAEGPIQPESFGSIPDAMWWGVVTLTTVGYGDVVPVTIFGKMIGAVVAATGVGLFAMPAGILGSGFIEIFTERRARTFEDDDA